VVASTNLPTESGYTEAFAVSAIGLVGAFAASLAIPRRLRGEPEPVVQPATRGPQPAETALR
jgi:hypothetical protein